MQIDTTKKRNRFDDANFDRHHENADKLRQAHEIFGDDDE